MTLRILAVDTTSNFGSLALVEDGEVREEVLLEAPEGYSSLLFPEIGALLSRHGLRLRDLQGFAAASGPGSFTGVRVGLTAVKAFAEAVGTGVVGVSNLQALACFGSKDLRATVLDARRGQIYGAVYNQEVQMVQAEVLMPFDEWRGQLPAGDLEMISGGYAISEGLVAPRALAGAVGRIAAARLVSGNVSRPEEIDANYVRRSDAEMAWKDAR